MCVCLPPVSVVFSVLFSKSTSTATVASLMCHLSNQVSLSWVGGLVFSF